LCVVGEEFNVSPMVEVWGFSKNLSRLGESFFVALEAAHQNACLLPDFFHIYKGGSDFAGFDLIAGDAIPVFHINDYPADPPRDTIKDSDRVFPGDGISPIPRVLKGLHKNGFRGALSLELFNKTYWARPAEDVLKEGLEKCRAVVAKAMA